MVRLTGRFDGKVLVPDEPVSLPQGVPLDIVVRLHDGAAAQDTVQTDDVPALFRFGRQAVNTGQPDLATNVDHYLYGHPKARDE